MSFQILRVLLCFLSFLLVADNYKLRFTTILFVYKQILNFLEHISLFQGLFAGTLFLNRNGKISTYKLNINLKELK